MSGLLLARHGNALDSGASLRKVQDLAGHIDISNTLRYDRERTSHDDHAAHSLIAYLNSPEEVVPLDDGRVRLRVGQRPARRVLSSASTSRSAWSSPKSSGGRIFKVARSRPVLPISTPLSLIPSRISLVLPGSGRPVA